MTAQIEMPFIDQRSKEEIKEELRLIKYWQSSLNDRIHLAFEFRHNTETTGWSMATQGFSFALFLWSKGRMPRSTLRRYFRFFKHLEHWEQKKEQIRL